MPKFSDAASVRLNRTGVGYAVFRCPQSASIEDGVENGKRLHGLVPAKLSPVKGLPWPSVKEMPFFPKEPFNVTIQGLRYKPGLPVLEGLSYSIYCNLSDTTFQRDAGIRVLLPVTASNHSGPMFCDGS